ncbi:hypothetical protein [Streptacidiphilus albus]|uniref:hypothetical protein n=1 Tax=Streptacidiphilus albus TaxID=105425 RepID=UPI00054C4640|nr:hypothetical protein [Streptacidiphilus albus]
MELLLLLSLISLAVSTLTAMLAVLALAFRLGSPQIERTPAPAGDRSVDQPIRARGRLYSFALRGAASTAGSSLVTFVIWWIQHR